MKILQAFIFTLIITAVAFAQATGSLRGQVVDPNGAVVPNATVVATNGKGVEKTVVSNAQGEYTITGLPAGVYTVRTTAATFAPYENTEVTIEAGKRAELIITLTIEVEQEVVTVGEEGKISAEPENNASATVLKDRDLESLPEDPEELAAALQALAGASAGPNGGQFFIDGFTGGRIPPREAIREIRINQNPFSAEFDRLGFGRIEILTRPGVDKFRGQVFLNFGDESLNSRNPFAPNRPSSQIRNYGGNLAGPIIKKKASFFVDFSRRELDDNAIINARIIDPNFNIVPFQQAVLTPQRRLSFSPRVDYAINERNTLVARYSFEKSNFLNRGLSELTLPSRGYDSDNQQHSFQITETAILTPTVVNETRFQYLRQRNTTMGDNSVPSINVSPDFFGGGAQIGFNFNNEDRFELQNYTTWSSGRHSFKAGARYRYISIKDRSESNYGGTFSFNSSPAITVNGNVICPALSAIEKYRQRLLGNTSSCYNPSQFSITTGDPLADVSQGDIGIFFLDDWRVSPALTLSFGLRYENQSNISSNYNFAPRFGFAWSPGAGGARPPKTVFRGGFGIFYERFGENFTLNAERLNGIDQRQYIITDTGTPDVAQVVFNQVVFTPTAILNTPTAEFLNTLAPTTSNIRMVADDLQAPYTVQGALSVERQLPYNMTLSATYVTSRTNNALRTRNINAPNCLPLLPCPTTVQRPDPTRGRIDVYESTGVIDQNQLIVGMNTRLNPRFTLFANYRLSFAKGDTDGAGTYPMNSYDLSNEYGRTVFDTRHNVFAGGSFTLPWNVRLNPFVIFTSGRPFNITTGLDANRDTIRNERPTFADSQTRPNELRQTRWGDFDINPKPGQTIIPRNYGEGPEFFNVNLNINKTFGFGKSRNAGAAQQQQGAGQQGGRGGQGGIPGVSGGPGGGRPGGGGGGGRGGQGSFGGGNDKPYNLTVGFQIQNLLNRTNLSTPIGDLSSSRFGQSLSTVQGFGFGGGGGNIGNRRIELQLRFSF